jgi:hypothetical protein
MDRDTVVIVWGEFGRTPRRMPRKRSSARNAPRRSPGHHRLVLEARLTGRRNSGRERLYAWIASSASPRRGRVRESARYHAGGDELLRGKATLYAGMMAAFWMGDDTRI